ncbi:hypothetical protein Taro_042833 [Colocasia esculenta]|uniref:Uncharacterized protein n=1 Tax=Colocasia esculenta TaxID=4460 RepID=A0A843WPV6_COLES|nr:hypothetical protein [Colocasia esculenta]
MTSILCAIISTLRISQKRKIFQPHFTLSIDALLCLSQAIECELKDTRFHPVVQQGLTTILMSTPPPIRCPKDKDKLYNLAMWAMSAALQSDQMQIGFVDKSYPDFMNLEEHPREEPVFSKLLRWITASINLGSVSDRYNERKMSFCLEESKADTLQLRLRRVMRKDFENEEHCFHSNEDLAAIILHLQYLLRMECAASPSIVSALCLLLSGTNQTGLS